jgi:hypothetical protein
MPAFRKRSGRTPCRRRLFLFIVAAAAVSLSCATARQAPVGDSAATATPTPPSAAAAPQSAATPAPKRAAGPVAPTLAEVKGAVARVYLDTVAIDTSRGEPFVVGDFNGDGSEDLAVVVRPAKGALPKLNSEYANWIVEDPQRMAPPDPTARQPPEAPGPVRVQQDDLLLLLLHGYRQAGWHDPLARQTFLLRNAVGENIRAQPRGEASGASGGRGAQSHMSGDVIREKLGGRDGFLYWAGARYAWRQ